MAEYDYDVQYRPGVKHQLADGVSRLRSDGGETEAVDDEVPCFTVQVDGEEPATPIDRSEWRLLADRTDNKEQEGSQVLAVTQEEPDVSTITVEEFIQ